MYITRKAVKGSAIADHLTNFSAITDHLTNYVVEDYKILKFDFPDEDVMALLEGSNDEESADKWKMYFDRSVNLSRKEIEAIIVLPTRK